MWQLLHHGSKQIILLISGKNSYTIFPVKNGVYYLYMLHCTLHQLRGCGPYGIDLVTPLESRKVHPSQKSDSRRFRVRGRLSGVTAFCLQRLDNHIQQPSSQNLATCSPRLLFTFLETFASTGTTFIDSCPWKLADSLVPGQIPIIVGDYTEIVRR